MVTSTSGSSALTGATPRLRQGIFQKLRTLGRCIPMTNLPGSPSGALAVRHYRGHDRAHETDAHDHHDLVALGLLLGHQLVESLILGLVILLGGQGEALPVRAHRNLYVLANQFHLLQIEIID